MEIEEPIGNEWDDHNYDWNTLQEQAGMKRIRDKVENKILARERVIQQAVTEDPSKQQEQETPEASHINSDFLPMFSRMEQLESSNSQLMQRNYCLFL